MLRITNLTNRDINISKNIVLKSRSHIDVQTSIDSRLYQLMNMNIIKIQEISEKFKLLDENNISKGSLRRKQTMERIRNGDVSKSVSLDFSLYTQQTDNVNQEQKSKKNKKVNK